MLQHVYNQYHIHAISQNSSDNLVYDQHKNSCFQYHSIRHIELQVHLLSQKIAEGARALAVWAYFTIKIERYRFVQYSWEYGSEINDLIGYTHSDEYVKSEINRLITECLEPNAYITGITDLEVDRSKETMNIKFRLLTEYGDEEMNIDV